MANTQVKRFIAITWLGVITDGEQAIGSIVDATPRRIQISALRHGVGVAQSYLVCIACHGVVPIFVDVRGNESMFVEWHLSADQIILALATYRCVYRFIVVSDSGKKFCNFHVPVGGQYPVAQFLCFS